MSETKQYLVLYHSPIPSLGVSSVRLAESLEEADGRQRDAHINGVSTTIMPMAWVETAPDLIKACEAALHLLETPGDFKGEK